MMNSIKIRFRQSGKEMTMRIPDATVISVSEECSDPEPDRVSITLTEREAELVTALCGRLNWTGPMHGVFNAIKRAHPKADGIYFSDCFEGNPAYTTPMPGNGYAHAERLGTSREVKRSYHADQYSHGPTVTMAIGSAIRLTMDRDVAVTLRELMLRLDDYGDLCDLNNRLSDLRVRFAAEDRFTGVIRWKKKRLKTPQLKEGGTYKLLQKEEFYRSADYEWEPVE